ncbi:hypothetical protein FQN60_008422 [Etheostoma spectabile]|uniref:Uncharacterized protein n=1 Tax=Etheostoma spectabile TaxID=54343 RepID=A0A5J5CSC3_9PERO|nr:hypothetical protein FQN60_005381 [Etheostoma spectabile]KAA8584637.1 hypothetical protein FQN60_008422 [Etheostoma spectabile]
MSPERRQAMIFLLLASSSRMWWFFKIWIMWPLQQPCCLDFVTLCA